MEAKQVENFLNHIKKKIVLDDKKFKSDQLFDPREYHIMISLKNKFQDSIAYFDYNSKDKQIMGINKDLVLKLKKFLSITNNHHVIKEVEDSLN